MSELSSTISQKLIMELESYDTQFKNKLQNFFLAIQENSMTKSNSQDILELAQKVCTFQGKLSDVSSSILNHNQSNNLLNQLLIIFFFGVVNCPLLLDNEHIILQAIDFIITLQDPQNYDYPEVLIFTLMLLYPSNTDIVYKILSNLVRYLPFANTFISPVFFSLFLSNCENFIPDNFKNSNFFTYETLLETQTIQEKETSNEWILTFLQHSYIRYKPFSFSCNILFDKLFSLFKRSFSPKNAISLIKYFIFFLTIQNSVSTSFFTCFQAHQGFDRILQFLLANCPSIIDTVFLSFVQMSNGQFNENALTFLFNSISTYHLLTESTNTQFIASYSNYDIVTIQFLKVLIILIRDKQLPLYLIDKAIFIEKIFYYSFPEKERIKDISCNMIDLFNALVVRKYVQISNLILPSFTFLKKILMDLEHTNTFFSDLLIIIESKQITLQQLLDNGLLDYYCIFSPNSFSDFYVLIKKVPSFQQMIQLIYCNSNSELIHNVILNNFLKTEKFFDSENDFSNTIKKLFFNLPSSELFEFLLQYFSINFTPLYFNIIISILECHNISDDKEKVSNVRNSFMNPPACGLKWANGLYIDKKIDEDHFINFLVLLSTFSDDFILQINEWILTLPPDHPLFKCSSHKLIPLIINHNEKTGDHITIHSLLPYIPESDITSNLDRFSILFTPKVLRIISEDYCKTIIQHKMPSTYLLSEIANRYLSIENFIYFLNHFNSKTLLSFCSPKNDHFSVFQLDAESKHSVFNIDSQNSRGISFWMKVPAPSKEAKSLLIFQSNIITIMVDNAFIKFNHDQKEDCFPFVYNDWHFLSVYINNDSSKPKICICFDSYVQSYNDSGSDSIDPIIFGAVHSDCLWYIGRAIRIDSGIPQLETLYDSGPGALLPKSKTELRIITPENLDAFFVKRVSAPYQGFPSFLKSERNFFQIVQRIIQVNQVDDILNFLHLLLNEQKIFPEIPHFWDEILIIIKEKSNIISTSFVEELFKIIFTSDESKLFSSSDYSSKILNDLDLWQIYPNQMIHGIQSSLNFLEKRSDFYKIFNEQLFINSVISKETQIQLANILITICQHNSNDLTFKHLKVMLLISFYKDINAFGPFSIFLLINYRKDDIDPNFYSFFSFKEVIDLLIISQSEEISNSLFDYLRIASLKNENFIQPISYAPISLSPLIIQKKFWPKMLSILLGDNIDLKSDSISDFNDELNSIKRPNFISTFFSLLLITASIIIACKSLGFDSDRLDKFQNTFKETVILFFSLIQKNQNIKINDFETVFQYITLLFNNPLNENIMKFEDEEKIDDFSYIYQLWDISYQSNSYGEKKIETTLAIEPVFSSIISSITNMSKEEIRAKTKDSHFLSLWQNSLYEIRESLYKLFSIMMFQNKDSMTLISYLCPYRLFVTPSFILDSTEYFFNSPYFNDESNSNDIQSLLHVIILQIVNNYYSGNSTEFFHVFKSYLLSLPNEVFKQSSYEIQIFFILLFIQVQYDVIPSILNCLIEKLSPYLNTYDFLTSFLFYMLKNQSYIHLLPSYLSKIPYSSILSSNQNSSLISLINGLDLLVSKGYDSFKEWIDSNSNIYSSIIKFLEKCSHRFLDNIYTQFDMVNIPEYNQLTRIDGLFMNIQSSKKNIYLNYERFFEVLYSANKQLIDIQFRMMEKDFFDIWLTNQKNSLQIEDNFKLLKKKYFLIPYSWPFLTPRLVFPLPLSIPTLHFDEMFSERHLLVDTKPKPSFLFQTESFTKGQHSILYPQSVISFEDNFQTQISPAHYTDVFNDNVQLLFQSFYKTYLEGDFELIFNCRFLKYEDYIHSIAIVKSNEILILLEASLEETASLPKYRHKFSYIKNGTSKFPSEYCLNLEPMQTTKISWTEYHFISQLICQGIFGHASIFAGHFVLHCPLNSIIYSAPHLFCHQPNSILISSTSIGEFILIDAPPNFTKLINLYSTTFSNQLPTLTLSKFLHTLTLPQATQLWQSNIISSYSYLSILNYYGGRSFSDLSQYPIFPWVISDYSSDKINIFSSEQIRDMSLPIGLYDPSYKDQCDEIYQIRGAHYGSHYSFAASVHHFLFRVAPYTYLEWDLHHGWDQYRRLFNSISISWKSVSHSSGNAVNELIPEFFAVPEIFINQNHYEENNGESSINDTCLPNWAKSPESFVSLQKSALEFSPIEKWINLIFGYQQSGPAAIAAKNVFIPSSYHKPISPDTNIATLEIETKNWGQCPICLFKKPHPSQNIEEKKIMANNEMNQIQSLTNFASSTSSDSKFVSFLNNINAMNYSNFPEIIQNRNALQFWFSDGGSLFFYVCTLNKDLLQIEFTNIDKQKTIKFENLDILNATGINKSNRGEFLTIDFSNGVVSVFQIIYKNGVISDLEKFCDFTSEHSDIRTAIDGTDFICASFSNKEIILWDIRRKCILNIIDFQESILDVAFDECAGYLWVCAANSLTLLTVSGTFISTVKFQYKNQSCTSFLFPHNLETSQIRPVICGFSNGAIGFFSYLFNDNELQSIHTIKMELKAIRCIDWHPSKQLLLIKDDSEIVYIYS